MPDFLLVKQSACYHMDVYEVCCIEAVSSDGQSAMNTYILDSSARANGFHIAWRMVWK